MSLYTNSNARGDFIRAALTGDARADEPVFIAAAFFTDYDVLKSITSKSQHVRLVVRLGFPTSPAALEDALNDPWVEVRYFTNPSFHPKLYIFGDRVAYVGSANLTNRAVISNQEILAAITSGDERFEELAVLFGEYWEQASVLTKEEVAKYRKLYAAHKEIEKGIAELESSVESTIGNVEFENIDRGKQVKSKENLFVESYRRTYQESVKAFNTIQDSYVEFGKRKVAEEKLPLRLEIDSFFSFVRDNLAKGDSWGGVPIGWTSERRSDLKSALGEWHGTPWPHLESTIVGENYPRLSAVFESERTIRAADDVELFEALLTLHSFHDRLRFFLGGIPGLQKAFGEGNDQKRIRNSLAYLVHGKDEVVRRMANLTYNADYKLNNFGTANVQEMIGWLNNDDLPVINGRTTKVLRYFGFDVRQL